jgi:hypothetical protein
MPDTGIPVALPDGWTECSDETPLTVVGPEADLRMSFVVGVGGSDQEAVFREAWLRVNPGFDLTVRHAVEIPGTEGWDKAFQARAGWCWRLRACWGSGRTSR